MNSAVDCINREISIVKLQLERLQAALLVLEGGSVAIENRPAETSFVAPPVVKKSTGVKGPRKQILLPTVLVEDDINGMVFKMKPPQKLFLKALGEQDYVTKDMVKLCYPTGFSRFYDDLEELRGFAALAGAEINKYRGPNRGYRLETP